MLGVVLWRRWRRPWQSLLADRKILWNTANLHLRKSINTYAFWHTIGIAVLSVDRILFSFQFCEWFILSRSDQFSLNTNRYIVFRARACARNAKTNNNSKTGETNYRRQDYFAIEVIVVRVACAVLRDASDIEWKTNQFIHFVSLEWCLIVPTDKCVDKINA